MSRGKLRSRREVVERVGALRAALREGLAEESAGAVGVAQSLWEGEGLGMLLWALERAAVPPFDRSFDPRALLGTTMGEARLRDIDEIAHARESARLWHWRARTRLLVAEGELELPTGWASAEQLIAAAALRGHERGLLPAPLRGDFPAFGLPYGGLSPDQFTQTLSIAYERHRALNWLCGDGANWAATPTDT